MLSQTQINMVEFYIRFTVGVKHCPYADDDFIEANKDLMKLIPTDMAIISHNGGLNPAQKHAWGREAFKKATDYKTNDLIKPANIYPCLLKAMDVCRDEGISLSSLTIGHINHSKGRADVTVVIESLLTWIENRPAITKPTFFEIWDDLQERDLLTVIQRENCHTETVEKWFTEWSIKGGIRQVVTPELERERDANQQWGAW